MRNLSPKAMFVVTSLDNVAVAIIALVIVYVYLIDYFQVAVVLIAVGTVAYFILKYYWIYPVLKQAPHRGYELEDMIGQVLEPVTPTGGKVKVGTEIWNARCEEGLLPVGTKVKVVSHDNLRVRVAPLEEISK